MPITTHVGPVMIGGAQPQVGDLYGGLQLSRYTDLSPDDAQEFLKMANQFRAQQEEAKSAAIRYQGQMEFQKLIAAGTDASEALRQTAPKIFYQHPQGITAHLNKMMPPATPVPLTTETLPGGRNGFRAIRPQDRDVEERASAENDNWSRSETDVLAASQGKGGIEGDWRGQC